MSVRAKMLGFVDVILRVPPIFIIDEILKISMGLPFNTNDTDVMGNTTMAQSSTDDIVLLNSSGSVSFNNDSSLGQQIFNASQAMFIDGSATGVVDDPEFYKFVSLTTLKFLSCLLGELYFKPSIL